MDHAAEFPILRDHEKLLGRKATDCKHCVWRISVPLENNLFWSLTLPYLMMHVHEDADTFSCRLGEMTGSEPRMSKKIQQSVRYFNPFLNRISVSYNEHLSEFVEAFKERITTNFQQQKNNIPPGRSKKCIPESSPIQTAAEMLHCEIEEVSSPCRAGKSDWDIRYYQPKVLSTENIEIILYNEQDEDTDESTYYFGIERSKALQMQKDAVKKILSDVKEFFPCSRREKFIAKMLSCCKYERNFIIELLQNNVEVLERLLSCPPRTMQKLLEAGFAIEFIPFDSWSEAFFLACLTKSEKLLYLLYTHIINTTLWSEFSIRESSPCVVETLQQLSPVIKEAEKQYAREQQDPSVLVSIKGLSAYHSFQKEISQHMVHTKHKINYVEKISPKQYETERCKDIVLGIVGIYSKFFQFDCINQHVVSLKQYENYFKYNTAFKFLDAQAAIFFFDNCFALKSRLQLPGKEIHSMESAFARFLFLWNYYTQMTPLNRRNTDSISEKQLSSKQSNKLKLFRGLTYLERLKLKEAIDVFKRRLNDTEVNNCNITQRITASQVHTLEEEPIIKDEMILLRLKHYITLAMNVELEKDYEIGTSAIEKCFQVIGESLAIEEHETPTLAKSLLMSCLDEVTKTDLKRTRNCLSHSKCKTFGARIDIASDKEIFQSIQKDLKKLQDAFAHIFELQTFRMQMYALNRGVNTMSGELERMETEENEHNSQDIRENRHLELAGLFAFNDFHDSESAEVKETSTKRFKSSSDKLRKQKRILQECLERKDKKIEIKVKKFIPFFKKHFQNHRTWLKNEEIKHSNRIKVSKKGLFSTQKFLKHVAAKSSHGTEQHEEQQRNIDELVADIQSKKLSYSLDKIEELGEEVFGDPDRQKNENMSEWKNSYSTFIRKHRSHLENNKRQTDSERLRQMILSVKQLLKFVVEKSSGSNDVKSLLLERITEVEIDTDVDEISHALQEFDRIGEEIFKEVSEESDDTRNMLLSESNIHKFRKIYSKSIYLSQHVVVQIKNAAPQEYILHHEAKYNLINLLESEHEVIESQINNEMEKLLIDPTKEDEVREMCDSKDLNSLKALEDCYGLLLDGLNNYELSDKNYNTICDTFRFDAELRCILNKLTPGYIPEDRSLEYFYTRVKKLHNITMKRYFDINGLGTKIRALEIARDRLVKHYLQEPLLQAAIEQLVLDCIEVLKKEPKLEHLWIKTNYLFNGINFRNMLAHCNPLYECVGPILDPFDFPNEIITKVLELLVDFDTISAMRELEKEIIAAKKKKGIEENISYFGEFVSLVKSEGIDSYSSLRNRIKKSDNWESYAYLIPKRQLRKSCVKSPAGDSDNESELDIETELR